MEHYFLPKKILGKLFNVLAVPILTILTPTLSNAQTYCTPGYLSGCFNHTVTSVTIGSFTHSPSCGTTNYTSQTISLDAGVSTAVSLVSSGWCGVGIAADFNNDGDFNDAGELLAMPSYTAADPATYNFNIIVPPSVVSGNYRLRIWNRLANSGDDTPGMIACGTYDYGGYGDYTLAVTNTATCLPPSAITIVAGPTTAALSWTASTSTPLSYDWKVMASGDDPNTGTAVSGGNTAGLTANATGLTTLTIYDCYVRSNCSGSTTSAWTLASTFSTTCDGTPTAGTSSSTLTSVCTSTSFTLSLTGNASGTGISYQWQSASSGTGPFTNISGANSTTYTSTQSSARSYRCYLVCSGSGLSDTSTVTDIAMNPANSCYCTPTVTSATSYYITSFSTTGGSTNISNTGTGSGAYNDYSASMSASAIQGSTVNISMTGSSSYEARKIFIDWNQDGDFDDANETVYSNSSTSSSTVTGSFVVPYAALTGNTRMRVRSSSTSYTVTPCGNIYSGETEDYTFTVLPVIGVCVNPVNLGVTGVTNTTATGNFNTPPAGNTPTSYIYELRTEGAAGSGTTGLFTSGNTTDTVLSFTSLAPATTYTLYARTFCSAGDTSVWTSVSFNTTFDTLTSVSFTGFNADVVANGLGPASGSTTNDVDGASFALVAGDFQASASTNNPTNYIPNNRIIRNGLRRYVMNPYTGNNSIRMPSGSSGVARFLAPKRANKLYVMGVSGSGASTVSTTIYFRDGTTQTATIGYPDWYASGNNVASSVGRVNRNNSNLESGPYLHDSAIVITTANRNKQIDSVGFSNSGQYMNVLAISIVPNPSQTCPLPLAIDSVYNISANSATLAWRGNGTNTDYQLSFGAQGTLADAGTIVDVTGSGTNTSVISSTLTSATNYQVFVRTNCGAGSYSDWIGPINFISLSDNCAGTPATGTLTSTATSVCTNTPYTLSVAGVSTNNGITLKWQSSPAGQNTWTTLSTVTPVLGTTTYNYNVASQTTSTDYRCVIACSFSNDSSITTVLNVAQNAPTACYCTPTANSGASYYITSFSTTGGTTNITNNGTGSGAFNDYSATMSASGVQTTTVNFSLTGNSASEARGIYIDWNQDGDFDDAGENVYYSNSTSSATVTGSFVIPSTALPGSTGMRVRTSAYYYTVTPCGNIYYGETEQYKFNVIAQTPCTGAPSPGNTVASVTSICASGTTNLSVDNNYITSSGITYQWQSSTNGTTWDDMSGATTFTATSPTITASTNFRLRMICAAGPDTGYSVPVLVTVHNLPSVSITPSQAAFCTSGNATLVASGADTYSWSPSGTLDVSTGNTVVASPTAITTYVVTGTDAFNCVNTATATVGPIDAFTPVATASSSCAANQATSIDVTPIAQSAGSAEYKLTDTLGAVIADWQSGTNFSVTPTAEGLYKYFVFARNTTCTSSISDTGIVQFYTGYDATVVATDATCANGDGSLVISNVQGPGEGNPSAVWYANDFNSTVINPTEAQLYGVATITSNYLQLTPAQNSQSGAILIKNPNAISGHLDSVKFNLSVPTSGADGLSWSFGDNVDYGSSSNYEAGVGNKLIVSFDAYGTGSPGIAGIYLTYGQSNSGGIYNTVTSTMLAYSNNTSWRATTNKQIKIAISDDNKLTLTVGTTVVFNGVQLPDAYGNADKSTWKHLIAARTGGVNEQHYIDNLGIYYNDNSYAYGSSPAGSGTMPTSWQTTPVFSGLSGGDSLDLWVANPSSPSTCNKLLGTFGVDGPMVTANLGSGDPSCVGTEDGYVLLKVPTNGNYDVSYHKDGGNTITQTGVASLNDGVNEFLGLLLTQGTYTNITITNASSCVSNTIAGPITLVAPDAVSIAPSSSTSATMNQPGAGTQYYTDPSCNLIAAVTSPNDLGQVTADVTVNANPVTSSTGEPFVGRFVEITPTQNETMSATIKLFFSAADFTAYNNSASVGTSTYPAILSDGSNLRIKAFHGTSASGTTGPAGMYDNSNADLIQPSSVVWNATNGFWEVTLTSPNGFSGFFGTTNTGTPLSIVMGDFTARNKGSVNILNWDTKTEAANDRFVIQRSKDARTFVTIGSVTGKGKAPSEYAFTDNAPYNGMNYYRLILTDADGSKEYSKIVSAEVKGGASFHFDVFPNPVSNNLTVNVSEVHGTGTIEITDITGRVLISKTVETSNNAIISLASLTNGIYIVKYHDDVHQEAIKVNKN